MIRKTLARAFFAVTPWKLVTEPAPNKPVVFVGAPHTSNWDFILMLAVAWSMDIHIRWIGKDSLFSGRKGPIMRALGGIPVDRDNPRKFVKEIVEKFTTNESLGLVITPDGTRKKNEYWKSGFYRIARDTGMPVTLAFVDRNTMSTGLGPTFEISGNVTEDMDFIREFFKDKAGFAPENRAVPRLREEL